MKRHWDTNDRVRRLHIHQIGILERDERQNGAGRTLEELVIENFPEQMKNVYPNIQNAYQFSNSIK